MFSRREPSTVGAVRLAYLVPWKPYFGDFSSAVVTVDEEVNWTLGCHRIALFPHFLAKHNSLFVRHGCIPNVFD